jgi:ribosome-binding protein aMBF1 (putative translation factor)
MPFVRVDIDKEIEKMCDESPKFKKEWEESQEEYRLIGEMISLRKQENITQKELAMMTGNKQQVISRIERKENSPSVRTFSNILKALGYELQIVKKGNAN